MKEFTKRLQNISNELAELGQDLSDEVKGSRAELRLLMPLSAALKTIRGVLDRLPLVEDDGHIAKETVIPTYYCGRGPWRCVKRKYEK